MNQKEKILELHNRNKIYEFISKYPGVHLRQIMGKIDLSEGTIKYHLNILLKENLVVNKEINGYKRFYKINKNGKNEQKIIAAFREKIPRFILLYLLYSVATVSDISREMNKDPKTISYHVNKLKEMDLIETVPLENGLLLTKDTKRRIIRDMKNREVLYRVKQYLLVYQYLLKYKEHFLDDDGTKDMIDFITYLLEKTRDDKYIKIKSFNIYIDNYTNTFYELFPIPWCA